MAKDSVILRKYSAERGNSVHISLDIYAFWFVEITKLANQI
jgi:hypothetical protein